MQLTPIHGEEILFAYINYGDLAEYINISISERKEYFYDLVITVDSAENVSIIVNQSSAYITEKDLQEALATKADKKKTWAITADTNWTGTEAPYTKTIAVEGMLATDIPKLYPIYSEILATREAEREAYNMISLIKSSDNAIELVCDEDKPTTALNLRVEVDF